MPWTRHAPDSPPPLLPFHCDARDPVHTDAIAAFFARPGDRARMREIDGTLCVRLVAAAFSDGAPGPRTVVVDACLCPAGVMMRPGPGDGADGVVSPDELARGWRQLPDDQRDASVLFLLVINSVVDAHHDALDQLRRRVDAIDETLLAANPQINVLLPRAQQLGRHLGTVRDGLIPLRPDVRELLELREPVQRRLLSAAGARWLVNINRDLATDVPEALAVAERRIATTIQTIHSERSESTNRIVALLTIITGAFFIPTLLTGLYGMNVRLPGQEGQIAFWAVIGLTVALIVLAAVLITRLGLWGTFRRLLPIPEGLLEALLPRHGRRRAPSGEPPP